MESYQATKHVHSVQYPLAKDEHYFHANRQISDQEQEHCIFFNRKHYSAIRSQIVKIITWWYTIINSNVQPITF